ncbi:MAG: DUF58 domain-containing protein [Acutalibacteraceae bacterium]|jgi:uncharacterized protein (DUF58 family)
MTKRGIGYFGLLALTLFLAFATGVREILWVVLFLSLLLGLAAVSVLLASVSIKVRQQLYKTAIVREEELSLEITLSGFLLFPALLDFGIMAPQTAWGKKKARFQMRHSSMTRLSLPLGWFRETFSLEIGGKHRGLWDTVPHRIRVYDAFGIFSLPLLRPKAVVDPPKALAVYPQVHPLEMETQVPRFTTDSSSLRVSVADQGDSYAGVRTYRPGDSMKRIHWVQTIRTRELQTRQYEISSEPYVLVLMDTATRSRMVDDVADIATETAATLAQYYVVGGQIVRLLAVGNPQSEEVDMPVGSNDELEQSYDTLMEIPFGKLDEPLDVSGLHLGNGGQLQAAYVISDRYSEDLRLVMTGLAQNRCDTTLVMPLPDQNEDVLPDLDGSSVKLAAIRKPDEILERLGGVLKR